MVLQKYRLPIALISFLAMCIGLLYSKAFISNGVILISLSGLIISSYKSNFKKLLEHKMLLAWMFLFFIHVLSGVNSTNMKAYGFDVNMKLPLLLLPFALLSLPKLRDAKLWRHRLLIFFGVLISMSTFPSLYEFIADHEEVVRKYSVGKVLDTPINHIRYSLLISFSIIALLYEFYKTRKNKWSLIVVAFLLVYLHILAVRSGLLAFYLTLTVALIIELIKAKNYKLFIGGIIISMALLFGVTKFMPTLVQKINYTLYDFQRFQNGAEDLVNYSDAKRLVSYKIGWEVFQSNKLIGVGIGDMQDEIDVLYEQYYPSFEQNQRLKPHNQFLRYFVGMGVFGGILFILIAFLPFFLIKKNTLFHLFNVIMIISFLMEGTIDTQLGLSIYITFNCFFYFFHMQKMNHEG